MAKTSQDFKAYLRQLEDFLDLYLYKKAPALPIDWKDLIVKFAPWIQLIIVLVTLPNVLGRFGLGTFLGGRMGGDISGMLILAISIAVLILQALAIPHLFKRMKEGWYKIYYASLLGGVATILAADLLGALISTGLSLYVLFQIKEQYS